MTSLTSPQRYDNTSSTTETDEDEEVGLFVVTRRRSDADLIMLGVGGGGESGSSSMVEDEAVGDVLMAVDGPGGITVAAMAATDRARNPLSISYVTAVFVLAFLCLVLGVVYGYLHYTKANSRWSRRIFGAGGGTTIGGGHHGGPGNAGDAHGRSTHIFLIRNNCSGGSGNPKSIQSL